MRIAWGERVGCKSRFALVFKNSAGRRCGFRVKMRGTSSLHGKLTGDFGNASEAGRISDCLPSRVFTKKQSLCNFRLLQHYLPEAELMHCTAGRARPTCLVRTLFDNLNTPTGTPNTS